MERTQILHGLKYLVGYNMYGTDKRQATTELISPTHVRVGKQVMAEGMSNSPLVATEDGQVPVEPAPIISLRTAQWLIIDGHLRCLIT